MTAADKLAEALREIERLSHNRGGDVNHVRRMFGRIASEALATHEREKAEQSYDTPWTCNVLNCGGNGGCIHKLTNDKCPNCGRRLVLVTTNGVRFCAAPYECFEDGPNG